MGVQSVAVTGGEHPQVVYEANGRSGRVRCRLVIGADGRSSIVRAQARIPLRRRAAEHLISGLLVEGATSFPDDAFDLGTEGDVTFVVCPQGSGRFRLYLCHALQPHGRFHPRAMPHSDALAAAVVAGLCATLEGGDTWTSVPFVDGIALIGDAAGYNDPLIGQGLRLPCATFAS